MPRSWAWAAVTPIPIPEMNVWLSSGSTHLWHLGETKPATDWEAQIDQLMQKQMVELNYARRKRLYDQVQQIIAANLPYVFLATPNILVGARKNLANFKPAILEPTTLWNVEQLYFRQASGVAAGAKPVKQESTGRASSRGRASAWFANAVRAIRRPGQL